MPIVLTLPVRTWASLDAALLFFRFTPLEDPAAQRRAKHCRRLHNQLQRSGVRSLYAPVGQGRLGKTCSAFTSGPSLLCPNPWSWNCRCRSPARWLALV